MRQPERIEHIQGKLLRWYGRHQRTLPWRGVGDPYAIWVSEIMLQQTQVATVRPYYRRFLRRFASVRKLAKAPLADVLKAWEGLGYYGRARNLHRAAKQIVKDFAGKLPHTAPELINLPGIGRYTAGAIASIAFGLDEPVLDGNVTRVLCRVFRVRTNPKESATQKKLWSLARRLVPPGKADLFNQALMDLGAIVCTPRRPDCLHCPLKTLCLAYKHNQQEALPVKVKRAPLPHHDIGVGIVWKNGKILIDQRKPEGLLGGLWEFPGGKVKEGETLPACVCREVREELAIRVRVGALLLTVKHAYSHFKITLHVYHCTWLSGRPQALACIDWKWVTVEALEKYAFPSANKKIIARLKEM